MLAHRVGKVEVSNERRVPGCREWKLFIIYFIGIVVISLTNITALLSFRSKNFQDMKKLALIFAISMNLPALSAAEITVFATGVNPDDTTTYYNNKQGMTPTCWAAAGSNVIAHWQENNAPNAPAIGISPEGVAAPQGTKVYDTYRSFYSSYKGGYASQLYRYWVGHHHAAALYGDGAIKDESGKAIIDYDIGNGGFYEDVYTTTESVREIAWKYSDEKKYVTGDDYTVGLSKAIYTALSAGNALVIDIKNSTHAVTLWGATFDTETNLMTTAWVTDSSGSAFAHNSGNMNKALVTVRNNKLLMDADHYYGIEVSSSYYNPLTIDNAHFLGISSTETLNFISSGIAIPEPSMLGLLAGLGALALCVSRRTRRRLRRV